MYGTFPSVPTPTKWNETLENTFTRINSKINMKIWLSKIIRMQIVRFVFNSVEPHKSERLRIHNRYKYSYYSYCKHNIYCHSVVLTIGDWTYFISWSTYPVVVSLTVDNDFGVFERCSRFCFSSYTPLYDCDAVF